MGEQRHEPDARCHATGRDAACIRAGALHRRLPLNIHLGLAPIISLLAGILILAMPRLLNYIVAIYLIVIGLIGLFGAGGMRI
jgi:hypothetical protein